MYRGGRNRGRGRARARGRGRGRGAFGRSPPRRRRSPDSSETRENQYCMFCKVQLSSSAAYDEHNATGAHKQKEALVAKALADGLHYCNTCEKTFPSKLELDAHCLMTRHQPLYRVEGISEKLEKDSSTQPSETETQMRRNEDDKERQKIVMKLNEMRDVDSDKRKLQKKPYLCNVCTVDCLNESNYQIHQESWRHRAELDKHKEVAQLKFEQEADKAFEEAEAYERKNVPSHLTEKTSPFHCEVCSVPITNEIAYRQHLRGRKHMRQVNQMKRPFRCYVCSMNFVVDKEFNHHLESNGHIDKAFRSKPKVDDGKPDNTDKKDVSRDKRREDSKRDDRREGQTREHRDVGDNERGGNSKYKLDNRKIELVRSPSEERDLREKLGGKANIVITKTNNANASDRKESAYGPKLPVQDTNNKKDSADRRAKELEFEAKFRKLAKEYSNNLPALKEKLTREREQDIATYQQFESTYSRLCREEDFVRENIRVLDEKDPRKEEYIRDMIRIQNDMREVRQELEVREMMIIKRESLFREKFPNETNNKVVIKPEQEKKKNEIAVITPSKRNTQNQCGDSGETSSDLRIQLERERLLKRLGPELNGLDQSLRDKLMAAIMDNTTADRDQKTAGTDQSAEKKKQMQMLSEREKQLQKELAALKSNSTASAQKKKITKSLVPQYDDVEEKKDRDKKKSSRRRSPSRSTESSNSSSSNSSDDGGSKRKDRKRRQRSPSDRTRKKRSRRSTSRDHKKKSSASRRRDDDRRRKSDRSKKPVKMTIKTKDEKRMSKSKNPLPEEQSDSENEVQELHPDPPDQQQKQQIIQVIGGGPPTSQSVPLYQLPPQQLPHQQQPLHLHIPPVNIPLQRREQFSFWKNPAVVAAPPQTAKDSPKDDVWDIAFSGSKQDTEPDKNDDFNRLFNSNVDSPKALSTEILNILKSVAPAAIQNAAQQSTRYYLQQQQPGPQRQPEALAPLRSQDFPQELARQFPIPVPESEKPLPKTFPSYGKPGIFEKKSLEEQPISTTSSIPETSGGRIRSILKKMKDPPPITTKPEIANIPKSSVTTSSAFVIPGLDEPSSIEATPEQSTFSLHVQSTSDIRQSYGTSTDERALYGSVSTAFTLDTPVTSTARSEDMQRSSYLPPSLSNLPPANSCDRMYERRRETDFYSRERDPYDNRLPLRREEAERLPVDRLPPRDYLDRAMDHLERRPSGRDALPPNGEALSARNHPHSVEPLSSHTSSYDRDIEAYRRLEQSRPVDRLPPSRVDPYGREPMLVRERPLLPSRSMDTRAEDALQPPVRRAGESENEFYIRFERFYDVKRRREAELAALRGLPPRRDADVRRLPPPPGEFGGRAPYDDRRLSYDDRRRDDRYDDRAYRRSSDDPGRFPSDFDRFRGSRDLHDLPPHPDASRDRRSFGENERRIEEDRRGVDSYTKDTQANDGKLPLNRPHDAPTFKNEKQQRDLDDKSRPPVAINRGIRPGLDLKNPQRDDDHLDMNRHSDARQQPRRYERFHPY